LNIGYNIVSAGKLSNLRTCQYESDKFYVVDHRGRIVSKGHIGNDKIFYLDDHNLLSTPESVEFYGTLNYSVIPSGKVNHSTLCDGLMNDYLEGVRSHHCDISKYRKQQLTPIKPVNRSIVDIQVNHSVLETKQI
jgi:hypothetical protein